MLSTILSGRPSVSCCWCTVHKRRARHEIVFCCTVLSGISGKIRCHCASDECGVDVMVYCCTVLSDISAKTPLPSAIAKSCCSVLPPILAKSTSTNKKISPEPDVALNFLTNRGELVIVSLVLCNVRVGTNFSIRYRKCCSIVSKWYKLRTC